MVVVGEVIAVLLFVVAVVIGSVCDVTELFNDGDTDVMLFISVGVIELGKEVLRDIVVEDEVGEGEESEEEIRSVLLNGDEDRDGKLVAGDVGECEESEDEFNSVLLTGSEDVDCSSVD